MDVQEAKVTTQFQYMYRCYKKSKTFLNTYSNRTLLITEYALEM